MGKGKPCAKSPEVLLSDVHGAIGPLLPALFELPVMGPSGHFSTLLYVDLAGNATSLWQVKNFQATWAIPSHDGKCVALSALTNECNAWMVENF